MPRPLGRGIGAPEKKSRFPLDTGAEKREGGGAPGNTGAGKEAMSERLPWEYECGQCGKTVEDEDATLLSLHRQRRGGCAGYDVTVATVCPECGDEAVQEESDGWEEEPEPYDPHDLDGPWYW